MGACMHQPRCDERNIIAVPGNTRQRLAQNLTRHWLPQLLFSLCRVYQVSNA